MNRELFTADGRDWFEPHPDELEEEIVHDGVRFYRTRRWHQTGGISGKFTDWTDWQKSPFQPVPGGEIPF